jgi:hypothetical protein
VTDPVIVTVPLLTKPLEAPPPSRVRALKKHLLESLRDLRDGKRRRDRLIQAPTPEPTGFTAAVLAAGCATCKGYCCDGGGEHAYIDDRTMARVHRDNPGLGIRAIIRLFMDRIAPLSYHGSCLFHGPAGCTLGRPLRAELCNAYLCNGLREFTRRGDTPEQVRIRAARGGEERLSDVIPRSGSV